jgi:cytochrome c2
MIVHKLFFKICITTLLLSGGVVFFLNNLPDTISIESTESKTSDGKPVFNNITYQSTHHYDLWDMKQSHNGNSYPLHKWDHIQIKVHKAKRPYKVSYHQYEKGKEIEFKASCFTCHANGPRVIRPQYDSKLVSYSFMTKAKIALMNLKIKSYGKIELARENHQLHGEFRKIPLRFYGKYDSGKLTVKTCRYCHNSDNNFFSRGELERQHIGTITHLTAHHQMPPWPLKLSEEENILLEKFINGLSDLR